MYFNLIKNDIRKNKLIAAAITAFILAAAALLVMAAQLSVNLLGSIGYLMEEARGIHFLQMHSGEIDERQLESFAAAQGNVEAYQLARFYNISGADIIIGGQSLEGSVQDNGFSVQNQYFDFLLGLDGQILSPEDGTVYVPIGYMKNGSAKIGDTLKAGDITLTVAGFLRDSAMNYDIAGSKRFLVSENDLRAMENSAELGFMEYLIEFRLNDPSAFAAFQSDYFNAGLPANGPPVISRPLLIMMNALTDGMMIAVLMLISALVILIAFLCIRFTLLAKIEEDYREIGVLKAIGLAQKNIARIYAAKYAALAAAGVLAGFIAAIPLSAALEANIRLYMGGAGGGPLAYIIGVLGAALIFIAVMVYVKHILKRTRKISAAEALRFGAPEEKARTGKRFCFSENRLFSRDVFLGLKDLWARKKLYITMLVVTAMAVFMLIVPFNIQNTISDDSFMTYLGIGQSDFNLYLSETGTDDIANAMESVLTRLSADGDIRRYTALSGMVFNAAGGDGIITRLRVDLGDHTAFPVAYQTGVPPLREDEIALSSLNANELGKNIGDELVIEILGEQKTLTVCGIYSDITAAGKTAKAAFSADGADLMRVVIPVALNEGVKAAETAARYQAEFPFADVAVSDEYMRQTFGGTLAAISAASYVSAAATALVILLITYLFIRMLVIKDRYPIAIMKALGMTALNIKTQYLTRAAVIGLLGIILGVAAAGTLGEMVFGLIVSSLGASVFNLIAEPFSTYLLFPLGVIACVLISAVLGVSEIGSLKISEHIKEA